MSEFVVHLSFLFPENGLFSSIYFGHNKCLPESIQSAAESMTENKMGFINSGSKILTPRSQFYFLRLWV